MITELNAQHTKDHLKNAKKENLCIIEGDPKKNKQRILN